MHKFNQLITLAATLGFLTVGASAAPAAPETGQSAFLKAAIGCAEKARTTPDTRKCWITQIDKARERLDEEYTRFLNAIQPDKRKGFVSAHKLDFGQSCGVAEGIGPGC